MLDFMKFWTKTEQDDLAQQTKEPIRSFSAPDNVDGAKEVHTNLLAPQYAGMNTPAVNTAQDSQQDIKNLIKTYRTLAEYHEVDDAVQEIVDDAIVYEDDKEVVWLNLDATTFSDGIKTKINDEFDKVISMLQMRKHGHKWFRKWYVDSRIYFHKILDKNNNIIELRPLNPVKMDLVREIQKENVDGVDVIRNTVEYYTYKQSDYSLPSWQGGGHSTASLRIPKDAIVYANSGILRGSSDEPNIIGYLDRAIKPSNQLKMLEDALVIYRLARAPERRVFYVDVGNLPTQKAQQYVNSIMQNVKNRVVYDTSTGSIKNSTNAMSMLEDYYLPRREGSRGTEVSTLPGGQSLGDIEDVLYFNRKLYKAMRIPTSRAAGEDSQGGINFGGGAEITRDELKFSKFIKRLQTKFEVIITDPLKHQLVVNNIITEEEWDENYEKIYVVFNQDSYFEESKDLEILNSRMNAMRDVAEYTGKYYSHKYVQKNILRLSDDQINAMKEEIDSEAGDPRFQDDDSGF